MTCRQIISHACALNWIIPKGSITEPPFPQLGHLWFMTCILFCYLYVFILGVSGTAKNIFYNNVKLLAYFVSFSIIWTLQVFYIGKFEQLGISILSFSILFFRGKTIIGYFDKIRLSKLIIIFVVINFSAIYWYFNGLSDFPTLRIWVNLFCALSWIVIFPRLAYSKAVPIALYISQISYELYLVHHPFTMGEYSLLKYFPMKFAIVGVLILSLCLASLLHYAVSFGQNRIKRVISAE